MVLLGTVFEMTTSAVLFLAVGRRAASCYNPGYKLDEGWLPGQLLVCNHDVEHPSGCVSKAMGPSVRNVIFYLVAVYKLTGEFRSAFAAPPSPDSEDLRLCRHQGPQLVAVGLGSGFMNGLVGLAGPLRLGAKEDGARVTCQFCFVLTQSFFVVTSLMRLPSMVHNTETQELWLENWPLAAVIPLPAVLALWWGWVEGKRFDTAALLRSVLVLLLLSSLMGLGLLEVELKSSGKVCSLVFAGKPKGNAVVGVSLNFSKAPRFLF
ncbi:unnamed protein product [Effrenium voratum]|uniref:Uncharacterized protein n=1 Tax=Effrenium voratum TaxID=2562239 RepID=A0AA36IQC4_9DINO|nr:unnamed protein product [Effrenium voratum]